MDLHDAIASGTFPALTDALLAFIFAYPFVTCTLWSLSGLLYVLSRALAKRAPTGSSVLPRYSVVIPFHAEPDAALATVRSLGAVTPAPAEIIIIDDGSPNSISKEMVLPRNARVVRLARNRGKAGALQAVLPGISTELVVCMDADTQSESRDWTPMLKSFADPGLAAVTGKIRPVEGGGWVEWFQALDYLTVIAVIKAAESTWGGLLTVSGAFTAYRTSALRSIGGWSSASSTEDIDASWRLQSSGWRLAFESDWTARVEMAPSVPALWRQRRRWSAGLGRALRDHGLASLLCGARHLPIMVLTLTSLAWMATMLALIGVFVLDALGAPALAPAIDMARMTSFAIAGITAFYAQLVTAMAVDGRNFARHWRCMLIAPLYPAYFWSILLTSFLAGFPRGCLRRDKGNWSRTLRRVEFQAV